MGPTVYLTVTLASLFL